MGLEEFTRGVLYTKNAALSLWTLGNFPLNWL